MFFVSITYLNKLYKDRKKIKNLDKKLMKSFILTGLMVPLFAIWSYLNLKMLALAPPMMLGAFLLGFKEDILRKYVMMQKPVKDLNDDDVLAIELMNSNMKKKLGIGLRKTLLESEISEIKKRAKKYKITKVPVSEYLSQFGPFIMASLILSLVFGDLFLWLLFF